MGLNTTSLISYVLCPQTERFSVISNYIFQFKTKKMTYSFPLLIFALGSSEALNCLVCISGTGAVDKDCVDGNVSKSKTCSGTFAGADGCMVMKTTVGEAWARSCCKTPACLDVDTETLGVWVYNESCKTDNCNTMDPSKTASGVSSVHILGLSLAFPALVMAFTTLI